jgi:hypothetical protein
MKNSTLDETPTNLHERLQRFCDAEYSLQQQKQDNLPFEMVSIDSLRKGNNAILAYTSEVLSEYKNSDILTTVATLVLLNSTGPTAHDSIVKALGNEVASLLAVSTTPFDSDCGNAILWERSLEQLAAAPPDAQRVRLALLLGQVKYSPLAVSHFPFWHREAKVMHRGDPILQRRVINLLEFTWAKAP